MIQKKLEARAEPGPVRPMLSKNARRVLEARYLSRGGDERRAESPESLFRLVASVVAAAEARYGASPDRVREVGEAFYAAMATCRFMPNSPTLMNAGRDAGMLSACFVLPVPDSIDGIFSAIRNAALIQKAGGGTGFDFSGLRPAGDVVKSSGGQSSGPLSFLAVFSKATDAIQQGAFRRGANMGVLRIDHPDILEFIRAKDDTSRLTNFNLSVSVPDSFMASVRDDPERPHQVVSPRTGDVRPLGDPERPGTALTVGSVFDLVVDRAHHSGEPGIVFIDRINRGNPLPHLGPIEATNPCGEQPLLPYESCNLASVNVASFVRGGGFDETAYADTVRLGVRFLDDVVDVNRLPLPELEEANLASRKIGLGVMGFADALMKLGIPYDSDEGLEFCHRVMGILEDESHAESEALAVERGTFPRWEGSVWDTEHHRPMRNATTTTVAPTGTISIIAGCSGGIEPVFSPAYFRNVLDGERLVEVNPTFLSVARERGFASNEVLELIARAGTVRDVAAVPDALKRVFVSAHDISAEWHLKMQAAAQEHVDAAVSKTVNFPAEATRDEVRKIYLEAHRLGLKGITVYRDGSRAGQPMALERPDALVPLASATPVKLPEILPCVRVRQRTPFGNLHAKISVDPMAERELEVFAQLGKAGDLASSDLEAICRLLSMFLRVGGSLDAVVEQLEGIGSSLSVPSKEGRILSLGDGLAKALGKYLRAKGAFGLKGLLAGEADLGSVPETNARASGRTVAYRLKCPECEGDLAFEEGCAKCHACGFSQC